MAVAQVAVLLLLVSTTYARASQECVTRDELGQRLGSLERLVHSERLSTQRLVDNLVRENKQMKTELVAVREKSKYLEDKLNGLRDNGLDNDGIDVSTDERKRYAAVSAQQAFSAVIDSTAQQPLSPGQIVRFDTLVSNLGNAFDLHLNTFRARATGWYVFSLTILSKPSETLRLDVIRDGTEVFHVYATGNEYNAASKTMVLYLTAGNSVWVRSSPDFNNNVHGYGHTSFTGFLLYST